MPSATQIDSWRRRLARERQRLVDTQRLILKLEQRIAKAEAKAGR